MMNAQEAIEIIENQITEIEELIYDRVNLEEGGYISFNQRIAEQKELTDLKEALSIVLESAKFLRNHLIESNTLYHIDSFKSKKVKEIEFEDKIILDFKSAMDIGFEIGCDYNCWFKEEDA